MSQTLFITGANRGIGLEFVRQYLHDGWRVIATCRLPDRARELQALQQQYPQQLRLEALDIAHWAAIATLPDLLAGERIDLLINNAGVYGKGPQGLGHLEVDEWLSVLATNSIAPIKVIESLLPLLNPNACIASLTSLMGSMADNGSGGSYYYRSSKAALNAAHTSVARDLAGRHACVVFHPGWVQTDMGGPGAQITVAQSVSGMREQLRRLDHAGSGRFLRYDGKELPW